jgi:uncharacterized cupredoxin-like copper-binding protein
MGGAISRRAVSAAAVCAAVALVSVHTAVPATATTPRGTTISVTLGDPLELSIKLSKSSMVPVGTVTFEVTNKGLIPHDFKLCTKPVAKAAAAMNTCAGKKTPTLKPRQSATLTVALSKAGKYEFLSTGGGQAAAGMKGLLGVGVRVTAAEQTTASNAAGTPPSAVPVANPEAVGEYGCPEGVSIKTSGRTDGDGDEYGIEPDDADGCV